MGSVVHQVVQDSILIIVTVSMSVYTEIKYTWLTSTLKINRIVNNDNIISSFILKKPVADKER